MWKIFFYILFLIVFVSCTLTPSTGYEDSSAATVSDADRIKKLETIVASLIKDTVLKSKQIAALNVQAIALKKNDSIYNLKVNSEATKLKNFMYVFSSDSIKQWIKINSVYPLISRFTKDSATQWLQIKPAFALIPKLSSLTTRYTSDSVKQWNAIKLVTPLIPKVASLKTDSAKQWVEINKLKSTSPVTQIPIIQSQIKIIQSKDLSQDKIISSHTSSIKNVEDTINVLKVDAGSDFTLDAAGKFQISPAGMVRIKASIVPLP